MTNFTKLAAVLSLCFGLVSAPASAGNKCIDQYKTHCPNMKDKPKELYSCIKQNKDKFTDACRKQGKLMLKAKKPGVKHKKEKMLKKVKTNFGF